MQDAASFNHNSSIRATAQKCLLHTQDDDPTSVIPAKAVIELSEEVEQAGEDQAQPVASASNELPTSTPASSDYPNLELPQGSSTSEIEPEIDDAEAAQAGNTPDSEDDPIPLSSTAAVVPPPVSDVQVAPAEAHPESTATTTQHQQVQHELLDSAMDIQPGTRDSQAEKPGTANDGTVSDAAMLAASRAVAIGGVQEKGVRTAAAAAAAALAPEVDDIMWPALMRQEAEGGVLLIEALKRSLQSGDFLQQGNKFGFAKFVACCAFSMATYNRQQHPDRETPRVMHMGRKLVPRHCKHALIPSAHCM